MRIGSLFLLFFLSVKIYAQKNTFELSIQKKKSFYNKKIIALVNSKLKQYQRNKSDTAFVEINDFSESTFFDAFITIKSKNQSQQSYYIFYNPHIEYYVVELNKKSVPVINFKNIQLLLNDSNYTKEDTTINVHGKSSCYFYLGLPQSDKELIVWSTIFFKPHVGIFSYKEKVNELYNYFSSAEPRNVKPAIIKKYKRIKLN